MRFSTLNFPDYPRDKLRATLASHSAAPPQYLDEIVDIACHAADSARRSMLEVLDRSSDPRVALTAIGLATSLVRANAQLLEQSLGAAAKDLGLRTFSGTVEG